MTSRERLVAATRCGPVDYVPLYGSFNPLSEVQRRGWTWQFPWPPEATQAEQLAYQVNTLGLDELVHVFVDPCQPPDCEVRVWLEGDILHKTYFTEAGELHASIHYTEGWIHGEDIPFFSDFNIGHFVEPWIRDEADLQAFMALRRTADEATVRIRAQQAEAASRPLAEQFGLARNAIIGTGLTGLMQLCGASELCLMTIEQPELVDAYLAFEHEQNLLALQSLSGLGIDLVRRNGFYETADFYGPDMLERFLGDRLRREREAAHESGMLMVYLVHTGVMPILDYLVSLGMDAFFGIDISFPGVDVPALVEKLCPAHSLWIGPSSTYHIWKGPDPTRQAVRRVFKVVGKPGLVLSQGVSSHSIMPWDSTAAMIDEWRKLR